MVLTEIEKEINKLDVEDKLKLVEEIWDSLSLSDVDIPIPEWQKRELDNRLFAYQKGELEIHEWDQVKAELRAKYS